MKKGVKRNKKEALFKNERTGKLALYALEYREGEYRIYTEEFEQKNLSEWVVQITCVSGNEKRSGKIKRLDKIAHLDIDQYGQMYLALDLEKYHKEEKEDVRKINGVDVELRKVYGDIPTTCFEEKLERLDALVKRGVDVQSAFEVVFR